MPAAGDSEALDCQVPAVTRRPRRARRGCARLPGPMWPGRAEKRADDAGLGAARCACPKPLWPAELLPAPSASWGLLPWLETNKKSRESHTIHGLTRCFYCRERHGSTGNPRHLTDMHYL